MAVSLSERVLSCVGAVLGLLFSGWLCSEVLGSASPWLIAPMGASAVLLFAVPASPLAQPRATSATLKFGPGLTTSALT